MAPLLQRVPSFTELKRLLTETYTEWSADQAPRLGAALSFYTMLSLAPLLILLIAIAGLVFGQEAARGQLFQQIRDLVGDQGAAAIQTMVQNAGKPGSGIVASIIGFATLVVGASSVASELKNSLNVIWNVRENPDAGVTDMIRTRSTALAVVLASGFLLVVSLAVSSVIAGVGKWFGGFLPLPPFVLQGLNFLVGLAVLTGVFAVLFRYLPDVRVEWDDVLLGAAFTSLLFSVGKLAIGLYLGKAGVGSTYGAAGSLVIVLVWVYYSAQIFFFGAEFTQVYAAEHGSDPLKKRSRSIPDVHATPKPVLAMPMAKNVAKGNARLSAGEETGGLVGNLIGSALAATKIFRGLRR